MAALLLPRMKMLELLCLAPMFKAWTSEKKGSYGSEQVVSSPCGEDGTTLVQSKPGAGVEMPPPWVWKCSKEHVKPPQIKNHEKTS